MLDVRSEVGRLRRVLLHEPGPEVDAMVPSMMEELLFDDILFGDEARREHRIFRRVLEHLGVEVCEARQLLAEGLQPVEARDWLLRSLTEGLPGATRERLASADAATLVDLLVSGVRHDPTDGGIEAEDLFDIAPLPNWCFQRDPQVVVGQGVLFSAMATPTRWREALLSSTLFRFHPRLSRSPVLLDPLRPENGRALHLGLHRPTFEGGDIMVLGEELVLVGHSERTNRPGVRLLAQALAGREDGPRWLVVVALPRRRAYMHLDTVLTMVDRDLCLAHLPVIQPGSPDTAGVYEMDLRDADPRLRTAPPLLRCLAGHGLDLQPVACGGEDPLAQQREQWTDGANALAVAPGLILLYDRNVRTAEALAAQGFGMVKAEDLLLGRATVDADAGGRTCILLPSHELSRARGGPHCLSHALERDLLD